MSASLVGSEMCIRDRRCAAHPHAHSSARTHARASVRLPAREHARGRARAVSYTHLTLPTICSV
eukprot:3193518-Alexandrium_andersonii.AAC.1